MIKQLRPEVIQSFHRKAFSTPVIGVTGGKGGVGKTTVAVNIAASLAEMGLRVALVDADVDAPNAAILLSLPQEQPLDVTITMPLFDVEKCNGCGECIKACRLNSLFLPKGETTVLLLGECNGCEACFLVCPTDAISRGQRIVGQTYKTATENLTVYTGELKPGLEESALVVNELKERVFDEADQFDIIIVDTSPGTHCNVINALKGADNVLAVTEPTPLGRHDLDLILSLLDQFEVKRSILVNRADLPGGKGLINKTAKKHETTVAAELEMDDQLLQSNVAGIPVVRMFPISRSAKILNNLARNIAEVKV